MPCSVFGIPCSVLRNPQSAIRIPCSAFRIPLTTESGGRNNKNQPDAQHLAYVTTAYVAPGRTKIT
jgi:hypothetical protein